MTRHECRHPRRTTFSTPLSDHTNSEPLVPLLVILLNLIGYHMLKSACLKVENEQRHEYDV